MGVYAKYGTIAVGAYMAHQPGSHPLAFKDQYHSKWDRGGARSPRTWKDPNRWSSLWPTSRFCGGGAGGGVDAMVPVGQGLDNSGMYEPYSCDGAGTQSIKWLLGRCETSTGVVSANATVQAFRTSDDTFAGESTSREDGTFACPTQFVGANHYMVAYKTGSPDVGGTTVNTLVPANLDGT